MTYTIRTMLWILGIIGFIMIFGFVFNILFKAGLMVLLVLGIIYMVKRILLD